MLAKIRNNCRGQSLLEVVMVAFILVIALVAMLSLTTVAIARNRLAKVRVVDTRLAQEGLEWIRSEKNRLGINSIPTLSEPYCLSTFPPIEDNGGGISLLDTSGCVSMSGSNNKFVRTVTFSDGDTDQKQVMVVVTWNNGQEVSLKGLLSK